MTFEVKSQSSRILPLLPGDWHESLAATARRWSPDAPGANLLATVARHPALLLRWLAFGAHMADTALPASEREIAILRVAWLAHAEYEWAQHVELGQRAGLSQDDIDAVRRGSQHPRWSERQRALLDAVDALASDLDIDDAHWDRLAEHLDAPELLDLLFTVGHYTMIAMVTKTLRVAIE